ncbi:MAG: HAD family hydrolase [Candidatus Omnitrophota bacterium]
MSKLIIFDLDGTLINAYPAVEETVNFTMSHFGLSPVDSATIKRTVGWGDRHLIGTFVGKERLEEAVMIYRAHHSEALLRGSALLPGAARLLETLEGEGHTLAVASNRPKKYSLIVTRHLNIDRFFECILCGDELERPKPYPDILIEIMRRTGYSKEDTLYVGDMAIDVETGRSAGVRTIAVTTGSSLREELRQAGALEIIERVEEVALFV